MSRVLASNAFGRSPRFPAAIVTASRTAVVSRRLPEVVGQLRAEGLRIHQGGQFDQVRHRVVVEGVALATKPRSSSRGSRAAVSAPWLLKQPISSRNRDGAFGHPR